MAVSSKVRLLMFYTALLLLNCLLLSSDASSSIAAGVQTKRPLGVRRLLLKTQLADEDEDNEMNPPPKKTKPTTSQSKLLVKVSPTSDKLPPPKSKLKRLNSTTSNSKLSSTTSSSKLSFTTSSSKPLSASPKNSTTPINPKSKKLTNSTYKATGSIKSTSPLTKKSPDLTSSTSPVNKTIKTKNLSPPNSTLTPKTKKISDQETNKKSKSSEKQNPKNSNSYSNHKPNTFQKSSLPSWIDPEEEEDLVTDFRNLPSKFQETLLPDLESISQTSKAYLTEANKEMTKNFKPFIGKKYAATTANIVSFAFIILPLLLVSLLISRVKTYFSLQKLLIFINIYLSIYFSILSLSAVVTGIEPLRFLFATSESSYVGVQILQTLCYVLYLLLLVMYLVVVFSTGTGLGSKFLGLGQMILGLAVGLHYYVAVFHRVVMHLPPKTNWKVHAVYATCFCVISWFATVERRKKEYMEEGGEEGKKN